jgi:UDP-N-acetylglucosamine 2-epimerase (non-hydrolysing)
MLDKKKYFVVLFHPETLTNIDVLTQTNELLNAVDNYSEVNFVFLGTNADTHADVIRNTVKKFVEKHENAVYFENLHTDAYHYLLKNSICLIGNSSSGIIEAPSLGIYTINIGDRQKGRVRGNSVIDVRCDSIEIVNAMNQVMSVYQHIQPVNPYYKKDSAQLYYKTIKMLIGRIDIDIKEPKIFYDLF